LVTAAVLFLSGMACATFSSPAALPVIAGYFALSLFYTLAVKTVPVFDGVFLSGLYTYRMVLGGVAGNVWISPWLLAFSTTFFLGLAFLKRYIELSYLPNGDDTAVGRRGYSRSDLGFVLTVGMSSGFLSVVVLALYLDSSASKALYSSPHWLWLIALILMLWNMRVWFLAGRKTMHDDPVWFAARDWVTWALGLLCVLAATAANPL
jgi:4-hydroxybenzoate polyprenyltransferase